MINYYLWLIFTAIILQRAWEFRHKNRKINRVKLCRCGVKIGNLFWHVIFCRISLYLFCSAKCRRCALRKRVSRYQRGTSNGLCAFQRRVKFTPPVAVLSAPSQEVHRETTMHSNLKQSIKLWVVRYMQLHCRRIRLGYWPSAASRVASLSYDKKACMLLSAGTFASETKTILCWRSFFAWRHELTASGLLWVRSWLVIKCFKNARVD